METNILSGSTLLHHSKIVYPYFLTLAEENSNDTNRLEIEGGIIYSGLQFLPSLEWSRLELVS